MGPSASALGCPASDKTDRLLAALSSIKELGKDPDIRAVIASQFPEFANPAEPAEEPAVKAARDGAPSSSRPKGEVHVAVSDGEESEQSGFYDEGEEGEEEDQVYEPEIPVEPEIPEPEVPKIPKVINSSTHRNEHARLVRRMQSVDIATCPEMCRLDLERISQGQDRPIEAVGGKR